MRILFAISVAANSAAMATAATDYVYTCEGVKALLSDVTDLLRNDVCDEELNCAPYSYDGGSCIVNFDSCPSSGWYSNGRENFRCSTKTGGVRIGRTAWTDACTCYNDCTQMASEAGLPLVAFDMYSDKCRCWSGTCNDEDSLPCFDGGDTVEDQSGNNWRCPAEIYYPEPRTDCEGRDITFVWDSVQVRVLVPLKNCVAVDYFVFDFE